MTEPVKRYKIYADDDDLIESDVGEWVLYDDYAAAIVEHQRELDAANEVWRLVSSSREIAIADLSTANVIIRSMGEKYAALEARHHEAVELLSRCANTFGESNRKRG